MAATEKYFTPGTIAEAVFLLSSHREKARIVAGGTDLLVQMKQGKVLPGCIINIAGIADCDYISYDDKDGLRMGAQAKIRAIASSPIIRKKYAILVAAAGTLGSPQVRYRATIAGNLCNASPSAETVPPLMVLGASVKAVRAEGERIIPVADLATGPGRTVLEPDEIVTEVQIPPPSPHSAGSYLTQRVRKALDLAIVNVAVLVTLDGNVISDLKIAMGAVAPTAIRAEAAEAMLKGKQPGDTLIAQAAKAAAEAAQPIDDIRSSAGYRRKMTQVLVARAIKQAIAQVK